MNAEKKLPMKVKSFDKQDRLWTVEEAIEYLGVPRSSFYLLLAKGEIKKIKIGKHTRFLPELLKAWAKRQAS